MKKKKNKLYLYDIEKKQGIELICDKGIWFEISEKDGKRMLSSTADIYQLIFTKGAFADERKRRGYSNAVFKYSQAIGYLKAGYTLLDTHLNRYTYDPERGIIRNGEVLNVLPMFGKYIIDVFSEKRVFKTEEKPRTQVKYKEDYKPEKMKVVHPFDTDSLRQVKRNLEETQNKPSKATSESAWDWVIPLTIGGVGIAALACWLGNSNTNYKNRFYYEH